MWGRIASGLAALAVAGCADFYLTPNDYAAGGVSTETFSRESAACEQSANEYAPPRGGDRYLTYNNIYDSCMRSKGYRRVARGD